MINDEGIVKLADFGLSRDMKEKTYQDGRYQAQYTTKVVTRWFRAPELSLEDPDYNEKIDVWSVGCTFAEMIAGRPLFPSGSDLAHFPTIIRQLQPHD